MGLVLKCTFRAKRSTKNRQIDFKTVLNDHISRHTTFIVINFWKNELGQFLNELFLEIKVSYSF